jgi:hypothetical protein
MKAVAVLVLVGAVMLNGCSGNSATVQAASGAVWQAQLTGGSGAASGLSFITTFTVNGDGSLSVTNFQFLNQSSCFPVNGEDPSGSISNLQVISNTGQVTGDFSFTVVGGGNTLTLTGPLTGTETGIVIGGSNTGTFSSAAVVGAWTLTGDTCNLTTGQTSFTMTLCTSATTCSAP